MFLQIIGSLNTVPFNMFLIVPFGLFHIDLRLNSLTRASSGVIVAHLIATLYLIGCISVRNGFDLSLWNRISRVSLSSHLISSPMAGIESERPESYGDTSKSPMSATGEDSSSSSKSKSQSPMSAATAEDSSSSSKSKSPTSAATGEDSSSSSKSKPINFDGVYEEDGVLIFDDCDFPSDVDIDDILDYAYRTYPRKEPSSDSDDDDDDRWDRWDPDRRLMTVEERAAYAKQVRDSNGFDVDPPPAGARPCGPIYPISNIDDVCRKFTNFAIENRESLKERNQERNLKLNQIIKWNQRIGSPLHYYITFEAEDLDTGEVETYQTLVERRIPEEESEVTVFRVRPRLDSLTEGPR